jgi:hypothetical protein
MYYHCASFTKDAEKQAFRNLVRDEIYLLRDGHIPPQEFLPRFVNLAQVQQFPTELNVLVAELEEILQKWGYEWHPPPDVFLPLVSMFGYYRQERSYMREARAHPFGMHSHGAFFAKESKDIKEKEVEQKLSVKLCRWVVTHCATQEELTEMTKEDMRGAGGRYGFSLRRLSQDGVLYAAEVLYQEEKTFEWLTLLNFLDRNKSPRALDASNFHGENRTKLLDSFMAMM